MNKLGPWTTDDFDGLSWHDVHVYGFQLDTFKPDDGVADLILDIDYILEWKNTEEGFMFTVCQAVLRFHEVFMLNMKLDYATSTAGMCPIRIDKIERLLLEYPGGSTSYHWKIEVNWPPGIIEFDALGFTQTLIGQPVVSDDQALPQETRQRKILPPNKAL